MLQMKVTLYSALRYQQYNKRKLMVKINHYYYYYYYYYKYKWLCYTTAAVKELIIKIPLDLVLSISAALTGYYTCITH